MKIRAVWMALALGSAGLCAGAAEPVRLTAYERSQGWSLLFDGVSLTDWRGYRVPRVPGNWTVEQGSLVGAEGPALVSEAEYGDFEVAFDWKVAAGGHGEVYFHVTEDGGSPEESGPVMDLAGHGAALGAADGLVQPDRPITPQFDVWYRAKIYVYGNVVEYWINGEKVTGYTLDTPAWRAAVAASKYRAWRDYGRVQSGRVALAGSGVHFRNVRVRALGSGS